MRHRVCCTTRSVDKQLPDDYRSHYAEIEFGYGHPTIVHPGLDAVQRLTPTGS